MFIQEIEKIMEVYINDMLVKSFCSENHLTHLSKMFDILQKYGMKLNSNKCAFGVSFNKFLGFMVNQQEVEANLNKITVVFEMEAPRTMKEVQR